MIRTMDQIAEQALDRVRLEQDFAIEAAAGKEISAARALGDELDRLEALAAELLTVRNRVRTKARALHTNREVGDFQTSEAELVAAPLQARIELLETERDRAVAEIQRRYTLAQVMDQRAEAREEALASATPAECMTVQKLQRQLDVALSQVSAVQRRKEELAGRVSNMSEWLDLKTGELASANEQRDQAREQERRTRAAWQAEIERGRDLEADLCRLRTELARAGNEKRAAVDRLVTIERLTREQAVEDELGSLTHRPDPGALANAVLAIREALKGFS